MLQSPLPLLQVQSNCQQQLFKRDCGMARIWSTSSIIPSVERNPATRSGSDPGALAKALPYVACVVKKEAWVGNRRARLCQHTPYDHHGPTHVQMTPRHN